MKEIIGNNYPLRLFSEIGLLILLFIFFLYTAFVADWFEEEHFYPLVMSKSFPEKTKMTRGEKVDVTFVFYKNRDDCVNPKIFRALISLGSGKAYFLKKEEVIQYNAKPAEEQSLVVELEMPSDIPFGHYDLYSNLTYTCTGEEIVMPIHTQGFEIVPKDQLQTDLD